jgi:hypothetical protein
MSLQGRVILYHTRSRATAPRDRPTPSLRRETDRPAGPPPTHATGPRPTVLACPAAVPANPGPDDRGCGVYMMCHTRADHRNDRRWRPAGIARDFLDEATRAARRRVGSILTLDRPSFTVNVVGSGVWSAPPLSVATLAQLVEHSFRKAGVLGSSPRGGLFHNRLSRKQLAYLPTVGSAARKTR